MPSKGDAMAIKASRPDAASVPVGSAEHRPGMDQPAVMASLVERFAADASGVAMRP